MMYNKIGGSKVYTQNNRCERARTEAFRSDLFRGLEHALYELTNWEVRDERKNQKAKNLRFSDHREQASLLKSVEVQSKCIVTESTRAAFIHELTLEIINELITAVIINQGYWKSIKDPTAREAIRDMTNYTIFIETLHISCIPAAQCDYKKLIPSSAHVFTINLYVTLATNLTSLVETLEEEEEEEIIEEEKPPIYEATTEELNSE